MRYAVLENNVVVNIIVSDTAFGEDWLADPTCNIGDVWDGEKFITPGPTQEEIDTAWKEVRIRRNVLLSACDWTQIADAPVDDLLWAVYRQELRDLPTKTTDPFNVQWPEPPVFAT
jgi:hypothetical protein